MSMSIASREAPGDDELHEVLAALATNFEREVVQGKILGVMRLERKQAELKEEHRSCAEKRAACTRLARRAVGSFASR